MTSIFLHDTDKKHSYGRSGNITEEEYSPCHLFTRYKHKSTKALGGQTIYVYKQYRSGIGGYLTLKHSGYYSNHGLTHEHVYFNKYERKTALLFVLFFNDNSSNPRHRFYKRSSFDGEIERGTRRWIDNLTLYKNYMGDQQLLVELLNENDMIDGLLTYQIDKRDTKNYNGGKIKVEFVQNRQVEVSKDGFKVWKHEPIREHNNKRACVLYNKNILMGNDGKPIEILQDKKYEYISVYWSDGVDVPLLIELKRDSVIEYYFQKKGDRGLLYWQLLDQSSSLEVLSETFAKTEIHTELIKGGNANLLKLLNGLKSKLDKTLVFILDKKNCTYGENDIKKFIQYFDKNRVITKDISVTNKTDHIGICVDKYGFQVYEHDFSGSVKGTQRDEVVHMKFLIPNTHSGKYNQLKLFKDNITDVYRSNKNGADKVYVYFYGDDPRPLMLCYNNDVYLPYDYEKYFTEWVNVSAIKECACDPGGKTEYLLSALTQVVGFLNIVNLKEIPNKINSLDEKPGNKGESDLKYTVQTFNGNNIQIKVTYWNLNCYRVYTHEPVSTSNKEGGFRLGNVKYGNDILLYSSYEPLTSVEVYYSLYDYEHKFPLLVALVFKMKGDRDPDKKYYRLSSKEMIMWEEIEIDQNKIEGTAHRVRKDLEITYTEEDKATALFSPENCKENDNDSTIIEASVGTVSAVGAAGGIGFGVFKYYGSVLAFFRGLF